MNRTYLVLVVVIALCIGTIGYAAYEYTKPLPVATVATPEGPPTTSEARPYGEVTLMIGETARFADVSIRVLEVVEDSRCPVDVQCIQAGTVRVRLETVSAMGTSTDILALGTSLTTEAEEIRFIAAAPVAHSKTEIANEAYRFTFDVSKRDAATIVPPAPVGKCYVGGCSAQLCSEEPGMASTCEWREAYACYQGQTCERQASGECGWTKTPELTACLQRAQ